MKTDILETISKEKLNEYLEYLDFLRNIGVTNMFGAAPYLYKNFPIEKEEAGDIFLYWMETFNKSENNKGD